MAILKQCVCCGKDFKVPAYRKETAKFCSRDCQNKGQYKSLKKVCLECKTEFLVSNSRSHTKFCGSDCRHKSHKNMIERRQDSKRLTAVRRGTATSKTLRKHVFLHKEAKCEICGYEEHSFCLDVHHIDENPVNNNLENLAILCVMCHRKLHKGVISYASANRKESKN